MILHFHDFILSKHPWAYCHLDEVTESVIYLDQTSNQNHLYPRVDQNGNFIQSATNQVACPIVGKSIQILSNPRITSFSPDWEKIDMNLSFKVSRLLSDSHIYRNRERIQNDLAISHLWVDFLLNDFDPPFYYDRYKDSFDTLYASSGSVMKIIEEPLNFNGYTGNSGQRLFTELHHQRNYEYYELQWVIGPIQAYTVTYIFFDSLGVSTQQKLFLKLYIKQYDDHNNPFGQCIKSYEIANRVWTGSSYSVSHPVSFQGLHRFTLGVSQSSLGTIVSHVSLDGNGSENTTITCSLNLTEYENYKHIGFTGDNKISNVAVFINVPFPNQYWLSASQISLSTNARHESMEMKSVIVDLEDDLSCRILKYPSSFVQFFDCLAIYGSKHNIVTSCSNQTTPLKFVIERDNISPLINSGEIAVGQSVKINDNKQIPFLGIWKVVGITNFSVILEPSLTCEFQFTLSTNLGTHVVSAAKIESGSQMTVTVKNQNTFRKNEYLVLSSHYLSEQPYGVSSQNWVVETISSSQIVVRLNQRYTGQYSDEVVIKKIPFGGCGVWQKTWNSSKALYTSKSKSSNHRYLLINDSNPNFASVSLCDQSGGNTSAPSYIFKNLKRSGTIKTRAIGDPFRCYVFVAPKNESVSHSQPFVYGDLKSFRVLNEWVCYLIAFDSNDIETVGGFNHAFQYPYWTILASGHLLCQSISSGSISQTNSHYTNLNYDNIYDAGYHIIPDLDFLKPYTV